MALIKCKECGTEISKKASKCPKCGVSRTTQLTKTIAWLSAIMFILLVFDPFHVFRNKPGAAAQKRIETYPTSNATYRDIESEVGCKSKYSDDKKDDIFNSKYKNHWITWTGIVELAEADNASLNMDNFGLQDLSVDFSDKKAGYDLTKGSVITVKFLMRTAGGCFLPFGGINAVIQN